MAASAARMEERNGPMEFAITNCTPANATPVTKMAGRTGHVLRQPANATIK